MIRVVEVISDTNIGGAGRLLLNRMKCSDREKINYTVILPKGSMLTPRLKQIGVGIVEIDGCYDRSFDIKGFFSLYKAIKKISPDLVNSHACISARIAGKMAGVDVNIYTRHCDFSVKGAFSMPLIRKAFDILSDLITDGIIAVSYSAKKNLLLLGAKEKSIKVIINGADCVSTLGSEEKKKIKAELNIPANATVVSIFARLEPYKDHKTLLRAAKLLKNDKNIYFLIVGNGTLEAELKKYAERLGLDCRVKLLGFVEDVSKIMNITDINVNCSTGTETSSLSLSEGMSIGIPAIASDYLGNKYMVKNGVNGLIFPRGDYKRLAKCIIDLTRDKALYTQLSQNAKKRFFSELNAERMTRETEKYYFEMLKNKAR